MSRFIESICYENGRYQLLDYHQERITRTFRQFFPLTIPFHLASQLPKLDFDEKYKVRVVYSNDAIDVEFAKYQLRKIETLRVVEIDRMDYEFKHEARAKIDKLFAQRGEADDIIIAKKGLITDSSYANLVFWDGDMWYTPKSYLLNGVKRQFYIKKGLITEAAITTKNLRDFQKVSLINALLELGEIELSIDKILV